MGAPEATPILICYDGSDGARHAIEVTAALFAGHPVIVLHAWQPVAAIAASHGGAAVSMPTYDDGEIRRAVAATAEQGSNEAIAAGLSARFEVAEVRTHDIARTILNRADQHDARLIVLGTRGRSAFKSVMAGSVSRNVAQHAHRPILIVPPSARSETTMVGAQHEARSPHGS